MIQLTGIARRAAKRAVMEKLKSCDVSTHEGVSGDFRGKPGKRQVTVLSQEAWAIACESIDTTLSWTSRRANLLISGFVFDASCVGKIIHIGDLQLEITKETVPCFRMDEAHEGMQEALKSDWRGGVCCRVIHSGNIRLGDHVNIVCR
jgi:MOSC domain-containing protein YiiM